MTSNGCRTGPRVFLADPRPDTVAGWQAVISGNVGWAVAGQANDLAGLAAACTRDDVDVLMVATSLLAVLPRETRHALSLANPGALVVACAEDADWAELHAALDRGANDVIVPGELAGLWSGRVYRRWAESYERQRLLQQRAELAAVPSTVAPASPVASGAKTVIVCGGDGGTGKSFIAAQLAGVLARHAGARVCLVDGDSSFGALAASLRQPDSPAGTLADIVPVLSELTWQHVASVVHDHPAGFTFLPGPAGVTMDDARDLAKRLVEVTAERFDVVVFDWPAPGPDAAVTALFDLVYILMTPDRCSAACARQLAGRLEGMTAEIRAIINFSDRPGALKPVEMERLSGLPVAAAVPADAGAGLLFDQGTIVAQRPELAVTRALVGPAQRIVGFEELKQPRRFWQKRPA
jgi:Flp pilus assembly CpaE family ATPase